jgi:DNA uptake protein ComE-like DNA-binding protein
MNLNTEPIKDWFGYSRRERRASFTLLIIIAITLGVRYTVPDRAVTIEDITGTAGASAISLKDSISSGKYLSDNIIKRSYSGNTGYKQASGRPTIKAGHSAVLSHGSDYQRQTIEINSSDSAALVRLPGIGPVLSARIIRYRNLLGGYARIEQLKEVYGLPEETFEIIKGRVVADTLLIRKTNINTAEYKEISRIPYLEKYEVTSILKYREISGKINSLNDLTDNKIISAEKAAKMGAYLRYE